MRAAMGEFIHDILGEGQTFFIGGLRIPKALHPEHDRDQQQDIFLRAHRDLQRCR
jgi:hypothetical protein